MNIVSQKNVVSIMILLSVVMLTFAVMHNRGSEKTAQHTQRVLPSDVETVVEGFKFSETNDDLRIELAGKKIIRRGRKILGLRSNLIKTGFFEDIDGTLRTRKGTVSFSASDAEWDNDASHPFILKKDVSVSVNGKTFPHVKSARVYFKQGLLEVNATRKEIYRFK